MKFTKIGSFRAVVALAVTVLTLSSVGCSSSGGGDSGTVRLSYLVDQGDTINAQASALIDAFEKQNPGIKIDLETRPGGPEGENLIKTRLATGEMPDLFNYNSGSLFQALDPARNLVPITNEDFAANVDPDFLKVVSAGNDKYGVPFGTTLGGGLLYNKKLYSKYGLTPPKSWDEFVANNVKLKDAGEVAVIQTYKDTPSAQMWVLTDYFNVQTARPDFAEKYTQNQAHFANTPAALAGFEHQEELRKGDFFNKDSGSATYEDGIAMLAEGKGAHYPTLSGAVATLQANHPENLQDIGFFPMPGSDSDKNGMTVWYPSSVYMSKTSEHQTEAKKFLGFITSNAGCEALISGGGITGPYLVKGCELPSDVSPVVADVAKYVGTPGATSPALEFLSPLKGPALPQITVEVGIGSLSGIDAAKRYDQDVKKQAAQLALPGW